MSLHDGCVCGFPLLLFFSRCLFQSQLLCKNVHSSGKLDQLGRSDGFSDGLDRHQLHRFHRYWYEVPKFNHHLLDHLDLEIHILTFFTLPVTRGRSCLSEKNRLTCALGNGVRSKNSLRSLESCPGFEVNLWSPKSFVWTKLPSLKLTARPWKWWVSNRNLQTSRGLFFRGELLVSGSIMYSASESATKSQGSRSFFFGWGMIFDVVGWSARKRKLATFPFFWSVYWPLSKFHRNCAMWFV